MPFFSVIIPLYNKENFIEKTLNSILSQTFDDFEIIIVNDGSTDKSFEKVNNYKDSRIKIFNQENQGASTARNLGIEKATANYITFLDADDYWYPEFLETMYHYVCQFPEEKVFSAAIEHEIPEKIYNAEYSIDKTGDFEIVNYFKASQKETAICTSCAVFSKNVFETVGNFDSKIKSGQDTDLWIRIGLKYEVVFIWKVLARYVYDSNSLSKRKEFSTKKLNFEKFTDLERTNPDLKYFLDLNRYSMAVKSKLNSDLSSFKQYYNSIDLKQLPFYKRIILQFPAPILKSLISLKILLANLGLSNSVFK